MDTLLREKTHILSSCTNTKLNANIFTSIYTVPGKLEGETNSTQTYSLAYTLYQANWKENLGLYQSLPLQISWGVVQ